MAINIEAMRAKLEQSKNGKKASGKNSTMWKPQAGAQHIRILPTADGDPFREWFNLDPHNKSHHDDLSEAFQEAYIGKWDRPEDFAEQLADDLGYLPCANAKNPNPLLAYVDFEWWWKSALRFDYDFSNGYVFRRDV